MAVDSRPFRSFPLLVLAACHLSAAVPVLTRTGQQLTRVHDPNVIFADKNGTTVVYSPVTGAQIPQGLATDGSGSSFSPCAIVWIVFSFVVGAPLLLVGFRIWRVAIGAAIGMAAALASWGVIVNTLDNVGVSDTMLTVCILLLFVMGFCLGLCQMTRAIGTLVLGVLGGLSIGIRIILLRSGLLFSDPDAFFANWLIVGVCGISGGILVVWKHRYGILNGCASTGSFLCGLGFDLVVNEQSGMSRGLRFLFDRNTYHVLDTVTNGYTPPMTTIIILAVSLGVTPAFAFAQWRAFKRPFSGHDSFSGSLWESQQVPQDEASLPVPQQSMDIPDTPTTETAAKPSLSHSIKEGLSS